MKLKEATIAFVLILAYVLISIVFFTLSIALFSVLSMVQPISQIPLYVVIIVMGILFGVLFKVLSKKFLHDLGSSHFFILSILFALIGSLFSYYLTLSPLISFMEPTLEQVTIKGVATESGAPTQQTLYHILIIYPISFLITFNIVKRK